MGLDLGPLAKVNFRNPPKPVKITVVVVPIIIVAVLLVVFVVLPKKKEMGELKDAISKLEKDISTTQAIADRLADVEKEYKRMTEELCELEKVVPPEYEVSSFLKQVNDHANDRQVTVVSWKENKSRPYPEGIVNEMPISLSLEGGYHRMGEFFSDLTTFDRIVNLNNYTLTASKEEKGAFKVKVTLTAVTYTSIKPVKCGDKKEGAR